MNKKTSFFKLAGIITIAVIVIGCSPQKNETPTTQPQTQTESGHGFIYGKWQYVDFDENGDIFLPIDEGPGDPWLMINDDNSMAYSAYETDIKGRINMIDANNYQFMVNNRSRMWTQETVDEIIYLEYDPNTKLLKYDDRRWEEVYYFIKPSEDVPTKARAPTQPLTPLSDFLINGVITAQVENGSALNSIISELRVLSNSTFTLNGAYANSGFNVTFPQTPDADILFEGFHLQRGTVSDQDAKMFFFSKIGGYDRKGSHAATFSLHDDSTLEPLYHEGVFVEMSGFRYIACFWYSDRDVTINGRSDGQNYNLNLKRGWNIVYEQCFEPTGTSNYSTTVPADWNGKWRFDRKNEE
jgi:hypothetical protein